MNQRTKTQTAAASTSSATATRIAARRDGLRRKATITAHSARFRTSGGSGGVLRSAACLIRSLLLSGGIGRQGFSRLLLRLLQHGADRSLGASHDLGDLPL